ncbi:WG repeat-containing protein [Cardiobacterium valvarum]|uniref:KWG Leptospira n=1 Tax=Cardiobacterium valvarum TaxID=194702 RepID=A0A381E9E7_9GAMM|nr:WG repeat-containing protein [Cardiobacterium valvarum]SUX23576.1 KWG Leptospira [Cardiobacterium valvarum]
MKGRPFLRRALLSVTLIAGASQLANARLNHQYQVADTNYPVPAQKVLWVAPGENPDPRHPKGKGTRNEPLDSIKAAVSRASNGTTIILKSGIYREPHFFITKHHITLQAEPHGEVWLKGSRVVPAKNWRREGRVWKITGNFQNFCHVCTLSADPALAKMSAYPEQVFINDRPLRQVLRRQDVVAGTFYVEDKTPTTLKNRKNNRYGYNIGAQDDITYYIGSNPASGTVEISDRARAFTAVGKHFTMRGINVSQYSPNQVWGFKDPRMGDISGPIAVSINGDNSLVENGIFAQNTSSALAVFENSNTRLTNNRFVDNGGSGSGGNYAHNVVFENNHFANNNLDGYPTRGGECGAYCGFAHIKITHTLNAVFRNNIVDDSARSPAIQPDNLRNNHLPGFWCDEGCINAQVTNNFFTNVPGAIFYEVSDRGIIASNIIEGGGTGISLSGSSNTRVYNNTISRTFHPIRLREDDRIGGCNHYEHGKCQYEEKWSKSRGLSWAQTGTEIYNNIISSRPFMRNDGSGPYYAYPLRTEGGIDQDGRRKTFTNDMFKGLDYNAYYRSSPQNEPNLITWDLAEVKHPINLLFKRAADLAKHPKVNQNIDGLERHALDLFGSRAQNPYFIHEAEDNRAYKQSDYRLRHGSPARRSGRMLPYSVARAIDPSGKTVKPWEIVDRGALMNIKKSALPRAAMMRTDAATADRHGQETAAPHNTGRGTAAYSAAENSRTATADLKNTPNQPYSLSGSNGGTSGNTSGQSLAINGGNNNTPAAAAETRGTMNLLPSDKNQAKYDRIRPYSEGMAAVEKNGRWGFIDQQGREIVKPQYQDVLPYGESRAAVKKDGHWGFVNKRGKETVKPQYDNVWSYKDGRATVEKDGKRRALDLNGNEVSP